jgi:hypothetical protein
MDFEKLEKPVATMSCLSWLAAAATHNWSAQPAVGEYLYGKLLGHFDRYLLGGAARL